MKVLSIDFDYFIDTDLYTRNHKFPNGEDNMPKDKLIEEWNTSYENFPELRGIDVIPSFYPLVELVKKSKGVKYVSESHGDIKEIFPLIKSEEDLFLTHVDFHHDAYITGGNDIDCANWLRVLMEEREKCLGKTEVLWCKRNDSEVQSLLGDFPYPMTDDLPLDKDYDVIFICFSPEWTPPHLYNKFELLKER